MISVFGSKELQAIILAMKVADKNLRKEIYARTREKILPDWTQTIADNILGYRQSALHSRLLLKSTRVEVGTQSLALAFATSTRKNTSGGLIPSKHYYLAEVGADPRVAEISGRRGTTQYSYKRKINTGFLSRTRKGRFAYKAANQIISRSVALWVQTVVQLYYKAWDN